MVRWPLTASTAIFAFKSALYCLRCRFICLRFEAAILHLSRLSEFWGVAQNAAAAPPAPEVSVITASNEDTLIYNEYTAQTSSRKLFNAKRSPDTRRPSKQH